MKKLAFLLALSCPLFGQTVPATNGAHRVSQVISRAPQGGVTAQVVPNATIAVTNTSTGLAGAIYFDPLRTVPIPNSTVTADASGNYGYYFATGVCLTERITYPGSTPVIIPNICANGTGNGTVTSVGVGTWPSWLTPSVTNATSTPVISVTASPIPLTALAVQNADSVVMNATVSSAIPTAVAMPVGCALGVNYSTVTHTWTCVSAGSGVSTTGTPASGNLAFFSGANSITNGDLSGDATTSGTNAVSVIKVNGGSIPASAKALASNGSNQIIAASLQGTDSNLLTSGTVSGTGVLLCTDGNGGASTSGCPTIFSNPMTTAGDLVLGGVSGTPSRLAIGTTGQVLTVAGGTAAWRNAPSWGHLGVTSCTTGSTAFDTCDNVITFSPAVADTSYYCTFGGSAPSDAHAAIQSCTPTSTNTVTVRIVTEGAVAITYGDLYVNVFHP